MNLHGNSTTPAREPAPSGAAHGPTHTWYDQYPKGEPPYEHCTRPGCTARRPI